jgi:hypothetical protein
VRPQSTLASLIVYSQTIENWNDSPEFSGCGRSIRIIVFTIACGSDCPDASFTSAIFILPSNVSRASRLRRASSDMRFTSGAVRVRAESLSGAKMLGSSCSHKYVRGSGEWLWYVTVSRPTIRCRSSSSSTSIA